MCVFLVKMMGSVIVVMVTSLCHYFRLVFQYILLIVDASINYMTCYQVPMQLKCVVFNGTLD
jgi:hypothetical protein